MADENVVRLWPLNADTFPHRIINTDASSVQIIFDKIDNDKWVVGPFDGVVESVKLDYNGAIKEIGANTVDTFLQGFLGSTTPVGDSKDKLLGKIREDLLVVKSLDGKEKMAFFGALPNDKFLNAGARFNKGEQIALVMVREPSNFGISWFDENNKPIPQTRITFQFLGVGANANAGEPSVAKQLSGLAKGLLFVGGLFAVAKIVRG